jgi:hypothetical protein
MMEPEGSSLVLLCSRPSGIIAGDWCGKSAEFGSEAKMLMSCDPPACSFLEAGG